MLEMAILETQIFLGNPWKARAYAVRGAPPPFLKISDPTLDQSLEMFLNQILSRA